MIILKIFNATKKKDSKFMVFQDPIIGDVDRVNYTTAYDKTPRVFKLVKQDGK